MKRCNQDGYALLVILLVVSLLVIGLARAMPSMTTEIQREHENRMIDHAREYRTAIQRYYHTNGRYPPSIDALVQKDGHGIRYLRRQWPDPLNLKAGGAWQVLHYGQAVTAEIVDQPPAAAQTSGKGSIPGLPGSEPAGSSTSAGKAAPASTATTAGINSGIAGGAASATAGGAGAAGGVGAGPVIGVASLVKKPAVHSFNGFDTPNDWQFVYNFALDPTLRATVPAAPAGSSTPAAGQAPGSGGGHR